MKVKVRFFGGDKLGGDKLRKIISALFGVLVTVGLTVVAPASAEASYEGFEHGFIISDENFYDGRAMETADVQAFLNQKVPRCTLGDKGREKGSNNTWAGWATKIANDCLKDFKMTTHTKPADAYCKTYVGQKNESAAKIITKVGQACGINQKVLLVTLQKEQSLITDTWPTLKQYEIAMGYGCPDSGPNYAPNCKANYYGFFNQVYNAARQLHRYKTDSYFSWFPVQKTTSIQYSVDPQCGSRNVFIENHATAALYYYTPYTPHPNILAGKEFNCTRGSTAQSNFFSFYSDWFEQPNLRFNVAKELKGYHNSVNWVGNPSSDPIKVDENGGGVYQKFSNGYMFKANNGATVAMRSNDEILKQYLKQGVGKNPWGWPVSSSGCNALQTECAADFTNANVVWSKNRGLQVLPNSTVQGGNNSSKDIVGGRV